MCGAVHDPFGSKEPVGHAIRPFDTAPLLELMFPERAFELEAVSAKAVTAKTVSAKELHERFPSCCLAWPIVGSRVT